MSEAAVPAATTSPQGDLDDESFLPVLKPVDWPGQRSFMARSLFAETARAPLVALGWASSPDPVFLSAGSGVSLEDAGARALRHLGTRRSPRFARVCEEGVTCIVAEGDEHTATHLLLPAFIAKLERVLGSKRLFVAIPSRFEILACRPDDAASVFLGGRARELFEEAKRANREPVFDGCVLVEDGVPIGAASAGKPRRRRAR